MGRGGGGMGVKGRERGSVRQSEEKEKRFCTCLHQKSFIIDLLELFQEMGGYAQPSRILLLFHEQCNETCL